MVLIFSLGIFALTTFAQEKTLMGKITAFDSIPLAGVDVIVKSTGAHAVTDSSGLFKVVCGFEDKLTIAANGFYKKKVKVKTDIKLIFVNLSLKKGEKNLEQAEQYVDVGYGSVSSKRLLNAVSTMNSASTDFSVYDNMFDLIQGQFPGVAVEGGNIVVRGSKTFYGAESNSALIVVDGQLGTTADLANISPFEVKSVNVLKDGSSSIYGSRGANGVVIIETKKGK